MIFIVKPKSLSSGGVARPTGTRGFHGFHEFHWRDQDLIAEASRPLAPRGPDAGSFFHRPGSHILRIAQWFT
jgi:hypothetical protein